MNEDILATIYQAGAWCIIGIMVLFAILKNHHPNRLAAIYAWLGRRLKAAPEVVDVKYMGTESGPARGSRGRILFTALTFGLLESLVAASLEGQDLYHHFMVRYDTGEVKSVLCRDTDPQYDELMSYVRWDDL